MIAFRHTHFIVGSNVRTPAALSLSWLHASLNKAALSAGYQNWFFAEDLAKIIWQYLSSDHTYQIADASKLEKIIRTTLCDLGYKEIASYFGILSPYHPISLVHCLGNVHRSTQIEFFRNLSEHIANLHRLGLRHVRFYGLQTCVRRLKEFSLDGKESGDDGLSNRVVTFIRVEFQSKRWPKKMLCSIS